MLTFLKKLVRGSPLDQILKLKNENNYKYRELLVKYLSKIDYEVFNPESKNKRIKINTFHAFIDDYIEDVYHLLEYNFNKAISNSVFNKTKKEIYYYDFFIDKKRWEFIDWKKSIHEYLEIYIGLVELFYISKELMESGQDFLIFKVLNYYLTNMEEIILPILLNNERR